MVEVESPVPSSDTVRQVIAKHVDTLGQDLWNLNKQIHGNPEIAFSEFKAHQRITDFLDSQNHDVQRHAYKMPTAFEAKYGRGGRCVNLSAEYDALPRIGHACGHNLIAITAIASYLALSHALQHFSLPGRAHLLGTPAEEDGGGKVMLLERGAYEEADVSLMIHPMSERQPGAEGFLGIAGQTSNANLDLVAEFIGKSAHAAANPWDGINALDAVVAAYNNTSMLRQQMMPDERIHSCILQAPSITNAIPEHTKVKYSVRSPNLAKLKALETRVRQCVNAAGIATGCEVSITADVPYADLRVNKPLCAAFAAEMGNRGVKILATSQEKMQGSTDMGNVSHAMPGLHAMVGIPSPCSAFPHNQEFAIAVGTRDAHLRILEAAKSLAMTAWLALMDDGFYAEVRSHFTKQSTGQ